MRRHRLPEQVLGLVVLDFEPNGNTEPEMHQVEVQERHPFFNGVGHRHAVLHQEVVVDHLALGFHEKHLIQGIQVLDLSEKFVKLRFHPGNILLHGLP